MSDLYPFIPEPLPNETFTSWLVRLADKNYFAFVEFLRNELINENKLIEVSTLKKIWTIDLDRDLLEDLLFHFSKKTGFTQSKLEGMMLKPWQNIVYELFITGHKTTKSGGLRYCPICLKEDEIPYYRKEWRLKLFTCCPKHRIYLYDRCSNPDCGKPLNLSRIKYEMGLNKCIHCGYDLSQSPIIPLSITSGEKDEYTEFLHEILKYLSNSQDNEQIAGISEPYAFMEALYFLTRFIISYYPFSTSQYANESVISSGLLKKEQNFLRQRNNIFENIPISHLILKIAYNLLHNPEELRKFISDNQYDFNFWTQKGNVPSLLKPYRDSKGDNPIISNQRIEDAIHRLISKKGSLSYQNVAIEASCAENFYLSHPKLRELVDSYREKIDYRPRRKRKASKVNVAEEKVEKAIQKLQEKGKKITYPSIAALIGVQLWILKSKPKLVKIIKPHLTNKAPSKKYYFKKDDILRVCHQLKEQKIKISINEVCRQLKCHKTFFRNNPALKKIILSEKEIQQREIDQLIPNFTKDQGLSKEAKVFEPLYIEFQQEMDALGKNWRIVKNETVSKKYGIPRDLLIEIKMKYCPTTKNEVRRQKEKEILKSEPKEKNDDIDSEKWKKYDKIYQDYILKMQEKGKSYKSAKTTALAKKLGIPLDILIGIKKKYCKYR